MLIIIVSIITIDKNKHVNIQLSNPENNNYQLRKKKEEMERYLPFHLHTNSMLLTNQMSSSGSQTVTCQHGFSLL